MKRIRHRQRQYACTTNGGASSSTLFADGRAMPTCHCPNIVAVRWNLNFAARLAKETIVFWPPYSLPTGVIHALANEIIDLSNNGLGDSADLLLPDLNEAAHRLIAHLDDARIIYDEQASS